MNRIINAIQRLERSEYSCRRLFVVVWIEFVWAFNTHMCITKYNTNGFGFDKIWHTARINRDALKAVTNCCMD